MQGGESIFQDQEMSDIKSLIQSAIAKNRGMKIAAGVVCLMTILGIIFSVQAKKYKIAQYAEEKAAAEEAALEVRKAVLEPEVINAQQDQTDSDETEDTVNFTLDSNPSGADVYDNGMFLGITPIDQRSMLRSKDAHHLVIILDGYQIGRRDITLETDWSDTVTLEEIIVETAPVKDKKGAGKAAPNQGAAVAPPKGRSGHRSRSAGAAQPN